MIQETARLTFPALFHETVRKHGSSLAYSFAGEEPITWSEAAEMIHALSAFLENTGISRGDRVAILSTNMPNWPIVYFAITFTGAVAVPVLPDFSATEVFNVLEHSGAKALFISTALLPKIENARPESLQFLIRIEDFTIISPENVPVKFVAGASPSQGYEVEEDDQIGRAHV